MNLWQPEDTVFAVVLQAMNLIVIPRLPEDEDDDDDSNRVDPELLASLPQRAIELVVKAKSKEEKDNFRVVIGFVASLLKGMAAQK